MDALDEALVYEAARQLEIVSTDRSLHLLITRPGDLTPLGDGRYAIPSSRTGETYEVTVDVCGCPAYVEPKAAGDEPRLCYHRKAVMIAERVAVLIQTAADAAKRAVELAAYRATFDAYRLPDDLPAVVVPVLTGENPTFLTQVQWEELQARRGMIILPNAQTASRLGAKDKAKDKRDGRR